MLGMGEGKVVKEEEKVEIEREKMRVKHNRLANKMAKERKERGRIEELKLNENHIDVEFLKTHHAIVG